MFSMRDRQGIIVWLFSLKNAKSLRRFGHVHYVSKRLKYVVLYCDMDEAESICEKLSSMPFVKKAEVSYKPFLKTDYENSKPDQAKEYDYRIGL
ncbi:YlbG family protein [Pseudogracilibacillus auburnensis]|uniref:YlbG family protein n=1 Tax=Pseudogracilibacillus auburnensis TaxID=1494959 RepID=UPI001A9729A8|nr:YlbG family protein [Pseudogracilibacillus auburnensis]MBO1004913.1 YlbG family protein [Pseudogracilibacillus auburnensis]